MSYTQPNTGNSMNDLFTSLASFVQLSPNLLKAKTSQEFAVWLDKLDKIDRRSLLLFIDKHQDEIPTEYLSQVEIRFGEI